MIFAFLAVLVGLLGCGGSGEDRCYDFPGLKMRVCLANPVAVNQECRRNLASDDLGAPVKLSTNIPACWQPSTRTVWFSYWIKGLDVALHEFCHADGTRTREECHKLFPVDFLDQ